MQLINITKITEGLYSVESLKCPMCASKEILQVTGAQLYAYHNKALIHEVLPEVDPETRERFISGVCPPCWDDLMFIPEGE
jgi:Zn ribbon nucleic-acid-binding protein